MPLPSPRGKEKKNDFISRCVDDETMKKEFSDNKQQRLAVCYAQWGKAKKNEDSKLGKYIKEFKAEAAPNKWIISYNGKNVTVNDLPSSQQKVFRQMVSNLKRDKLFDKVKKVGDTKNPDMVLKADGVEVYDEGGKLLKRYKL